MYLILLIAVYLSDKGKPRDDELYTDETVHNKVKLCVESQNHLSHGIIKVLRVGWWWNARKLIFNRFFILHFLLLLLLCVIQFWLYLHRFATRGGEIMKKIYDLSMKLKYLFFGYKLNWTESYLDFMKFLNAFLVFCNQSFLRFTPLN